MNIMKIIKFNITHVIIMLLLFAACNSEILDKDPLDQASDAAVWQDPVLTESFVNGIYFGLAHDMNDIMLSNHTDESVYTHIGAADVPQGNITPTNLYSTTWGSAWWTGPPGRWNYHWGNIWNIIRYTNLFFANFNPDLFDDQRLAQELTGEVHFLRAMKYHDLVKLWGGVPIITEPFELDSDMQIPRATFAEVVEFVISECDEAIARLDWQSRDLGRATKGAALALKNKMLTYAASDLYHNPDPEWIGGYGNPELVSWTGASSQQQLWERARDAALEIINNGPYGLYNVHDDPTQNFQDIWLQGGGNEAIMSRYFREELIIGWAPNWRAGFHWVTFGLWHGPNGYLTWGGATPSQNLVDDFQTIDGETFDWNNPAHALDPYNNRDPRFRATIMHDGYQWKERPDGPRNTDPVGIIETTLQIRCVGSPQCPAPRGGLDSRNSAFEDWNGTRTGYLLNKFIDPNVVHHNRNQEVPWHYFRYAEVLLNYAEAQIELGAEAEALQAINQIRRRAGMPDINATGAALVESYRNERRVELAFEMHRYFDTRRWMIASEVEDQDALGIYLISEYQYDPNEPMNGMYNRQYVLAPGEAPEGSFIPAGNPNIAIYPVWLRAWNPATYKLPIIHDEMNRNTALVQNPRY
jgi:starch-binding outer membrane protein, SusD/RagB family